MRIEMYEGGGRTASSLGLKQDGSGSLPSRSAPRKGAD